MPSLLRQHNLSSNGVKLCSKILSERFPFDRKKDIATIENAGDKRREFVLKKLVAQHQATQRADALDYLISTKKKARRETWDFQSEEGDFGLPIETLSCCLCGGLSSSTSCGRCFAETCDKCLGAQILSSLESFNEFNAPWEGIRCGDCGGDFATSQLKDLCGAEEYALICILEDSRKSEQARLEADFVQVEMEAEPQAEKVAKDDSCMVCFGWGDVDRLSCCGGSLCNECIVDYAMISQPKVISIRSAPVIPCPAPNCKQHIPYEKFESLLSTEQQKTFRDRMGDQKVKVDAGLRRVVLSPSDTSLLVKQLASQDQAGARAVANATLLWAVTNTKNCPSCSAIIEKNGGCDHMRCTACNTDFQWSQAKNEVQVSEATFKTIERNTHFEFVPAGDASRKKIVTEKGFVMESVPDFSCVGITFAKRRH